MTQQTQQTGPRILAAMAAYNEAGHVATVVEQARRYVHEVLVVDDGSTDDTAGVAELAGARVIRHDHNRGKGAALQTILAEARNSNPDVLVLLDADGQHDPDDIPAVIEPISRGFDLVIGSRMAQDQKTPPYRRIGRTVLLHFARLASQTRITDSESGFRALSPRAIDELRLTSRGFAVESEMITLAALKKLRITEVPITNIYTIDGSTLHPIRHGIDVLSGILLMIAQRRPLLLFGLLGAVLLAVAIIIGLNVLTTLMAGGGLSMSRATIMVLFLIAAALAFVTGIALKILARRR
jgi:glycosyltransferase involved in cell wall biosynthesis